MYDDGHITTIITFLNAAEIRQIDPFPNYYFSLMVYVSRDKSPTYFYSLTLWKL